MLSFRERWYDINSSNDLSEPTRLKLTSLPDDEFMMISLRLTIRDILMITQIYHLEISEKIFLNTLMEITQTTQGNLSHQLKKLNEEGYIQIEKTFKGNYPLTICRLAPKGRKAFESYVESIKKYLHL